MLSSLRILAWRVVEHTRRIIQPTKVWKPVYNEANCNYSLVKSQSGLKPSTNSVGRGPHNSNAVIRATESPLVSILGRLGPFVSTAVRRIVTPRNFRSYNYGNTAPLFALVGVTLLASEDDETEDGIARRYRGFVTKEEELEALCCSIRQAAYRTAWLYDSPASSPTVDINTENQVFSLDDLELAGVIDKGCNAVVYAARWNNQKEDQDTFNGNVETDVKNKTSDFNVNTAENTSNSSASDKYNLNLLSSISSLASFHHNDEGLQSNILNRFSSNPNLASSNLYSTLPLHNSTLNLTSTYYDNEQSGISFTTIGLPSTNVDLISLQLNDTTVANENKNQQESLSSIISKGKFGTPVCPRRVRFKIPPQNKSEASNSSEEQTEDNSPCVSSSSSPSEHYPLAVKLVFNYEAASNAPAILSALYRELIPARSIRLDELYSSWRDNFFGESDQILLPYHPNIVDMPCAFVDRIPLLKGGMQLYPTALPPRLNPEGMGRNMSLFCVMKRYDLSLDSYLLQHPHLSARTSLLLLTQLMEALLHLSNNNISHRDIKPDNILISLIDGHESPWLVLTDFGCCIAATSKSGLVVPFMSKESEPRQGNTALMAPEVKSARPGLLKSINFTKCDLWAAGTLAYQFYGLKNPFLNEVESAKPLCSSSYKESQLPGLLRSNAPPPIRRLVADLLRKSPHNRPDATIAATICQLNLWGPSSWLNRHSIARPKNQQVMEWLLCLTTKVICEKRKDMRGSGVIEHRIITTFLSRIKYADVINAINWNKAF